jgi:hypothetical protein
MVPVIVMFTGSIVQMGKGGRGGAPLAQWIEEPEGGRMEEEGKGRRDERERGRRGD